MYKPSIPKEQLSDLWRLKHYAAQGPIALQVRKAISSYLQNQKKRIGCPIADLAEAIERHKETEAMQGYQKEKKANQDWRVKLENQIRDRNQRLSKKIYR